MEAFTPDLITEARELAAEASLKLLAHFGYRETVEWVRVNQRLFLERMGVRR